jgi:hypothetical protein
MSNRENELKLDEVIEHYCELANLAQEVVDRWESGDLAEAVRNLAEFLKFLDEPVE